MFYWPNRDYNQQDCALSDFLSEYPVQEQCAIGKIVG